MPPPSLPSCETVWFPAEQGRDELDEAAELATEAVTGRATHQISGGPSGLDEGLYRELRLALGVRSAALVDESSPSGSIPRT